VISPRLHAIRTALTVRERGRLAAMFGFILAVNVATDQPSPRRYVPGS
jgi:hypothetical protein